MSDIGGTIAPGKVLIYVLCPAYGHSPAKRLGAIVEATDIRSETRTSDLGGKIYSVDMRRGIGKVVR